MINEPTEIALYLLILLQVGVLYAVLRLGRERTVFTSNRGGGDCEGGRAENHRGEASVEALFGMKEIGVEIEGPPLDLTPEIEKAIQELIRVGMQVEDLSSLCGRSFSVSLDGDRIKDLKNSGFVPVERSQSPLPESLPVEDRYFLVTEDGRLGVISQNSNLDVVTASLSAWKLLAFITATKYLADIRDRLSSIESEVSEIRSWLQESRAASIGGNLRYLESIMRAGELGSLSIDEARACVNQVEAIERQCIQHISSFKFESDRRVHSLRRLRFSDAASVDTRKKAEALIETFRECSRSAIAVLGVRLAAIQVRYALLGPSPFLLGRLDGIVRQLGELKADQSDFFTLVEERLPLLGTDSWNLFSKGFNQQQREILRGTSQDTAQRLREICREFEAAAEQTAAELQEAIGARAVNLLVSIGAGGCVEARRPEFSGLEE